MCYLVTSINQLSLRWLSAILLLRTTALFSPSHTFVALVQPYRTLGLLLCIRCTQPRYLVVVHISSVQVAKYFSAKINVATEKKLSVCRVSSVQKTTCNKLQSKTTTTFDNKLRRQRRCLHQRLRRIYHQQREAASFSCRRRWGVSLSQGDMVLSPQEYCVAFLFPSGGWGVSFPTNEMRRPSLRGSCLGQPGLRAQVLHLSKDKVF